MRIGSRIFCITLFVCSFTRAADGPASYSREDILKYAPTVTLQLRSAVVADREKAFEIVQQVAAKSPRGLSDNLPQWVDPLLENEKFDEILSLTAAAIVDRAFDVVAVEKLQEARVRALIGLEKLDQALIEAKGFYNICVLSGTPYAIDLLSHVLERQGRGPVASRLKFEQTTAPPSPVIQPTDPSVEPFENGLPLGTTVLTSIKVNPSTYQEALDKLGAGRSYGNFMARGNLLLLMDRPAEAKKFFENASSAADNTSSKGMREAIEGIARAIKAKDGSAGQANASVLSVRQDPSKILASTVDPNALREAARQIMLAPVAAMSPPALEEERAKHESQDPARGISVAYEFEFGSPLRAHMVSGSLLKVVLTPAVRTLCDWFFFRVDGAKGKTVRIDITTDMAPLDKWWTLNPLVCDAADYDRPSLPGKNDARSSLSSSEIDSDGRGLPDTSDQSWHYIADAWRSDGRTFSFVYTFTSDHSYISMRVPYPPSQNVDFLRNFSASNKLVDLIEIGKSRQNRPLLMAKIGTGDSKSKPCVLIYAGEHADEADGMWAARGAIEFLASDNPQAAKLRNNCTFLIIPQLDPEGSARGIHEGINATFLTNVRSLESVAYANWFQSWIDAGNRLDLIFDLHNLQSSEMGHVQCAVMEGVGERGVLASSVHRSVFQSTRSAGFEMVTTPMMRGWFPARLGGWLSRRYGSVALAYELNSQAPLRHLNLRELKELGSSLARAAQDCLASPDGAKLKANVDARRKERLARWAANPGKALGMDAIQAESIISLGVGLAQEGNPDDKSIEKWIP